MVVQVNNKNERERSRSSEQKFGRLQKLESKNLKEEASPNFGATVQKLVIPAIEFSNFHTGERLKQKLEKTKADDEKFGDLSSLPMSKIEPLNFIGPSPLILKNQQVSGSKPTPGRLQSNTARP